MSKKLSTSFTMGKMGNFNRALAAISAGSGFFTYKGISIGADTVGERAACTVFAIVTAIAIYFFWRFAFKAVRDWVRPQDKVLGLTLVACGVLVIVALSSNFNVAAFNNGAAQEQHQAAYVEDIGLAVDDAFQDIQFLESVGADLRQQIAQYQQSASDELTSGKYTGSAGPGAVVNALNGIEARLAALLGEVNAFTGNAHKLNREARSRLETIREISGKDDTLDERSRQIANEADAIRNLLSQMDAAILSASITRTLESLAREVDLHANLSGNSRTARRQEAALERVRIEAEKTAADLAVFVVNSSNEGNRIAAFQSISATRAVAVYWRENIPQWAGGLGLDLMPLAFLLFIMLSMSARDLEDLSIEALLQTPVINVIQLKLLEGILRGKPPTQEELDVVRGQVLKLPVARDE